MGNVLGGIERGVTIYQVDAFTEQPYQENPAAVCLLEVNRSEEWIGVY